MQMYECTNRPSRLQETHVFSGIAHAADVDARQQRLYNVNRGECRKECRVLADGSTAAGQHLEQEPGDDGRRQVARCDQQATSEWRKQLAEGLAGRQYLVTVAESASEATVVGGMEAALCM